MSEDSSNPATHQQIYKALPWGPMAAVVLTVLSFVLAQLLGGLLVGLYPHLMGWSSAHASAWANSTSGQFAYVALSEAFILLAIWLFLRHRKASWKDLGLSRKPRWQDAGLVLIGAAGYFMLYMLTLIVVGMLTDINVGQKQDIGFNDVVGAAPLLMTFISLVVLPPFVEEVVFRGFLYGGLRKRFSFVPTVTVTSLLFASPHLLESGDSSLLWVAGVDTFVLSVVLCLLREKTKALWASIGLHVLKNGTAFLMLFVFSAH